MLWMDGCIIAVWLVRLCCLDRGVVRRTYIYWLSSRSKLQCMHTSVRGQGASVLCWLRTGCCPPLPKTSRRVLVLRWGIGALPGAGVLSSKLLVTCCIHCCCCLPLPLCSRCRCAPEP
jgi:hypothetical protein